MTNEEIRQKIQSSFHPYCCVAEIWDYKRKIRFRVFDKDDNPIITITKTRISKINSETSLSSLIKSIKDKIKAKGYPID
ncbi:MAG: DUF1652 domain-containing protein [Desulfobacterales bacterium]|nr:DUF1652 domain-containing protein [Desulfobacterales bacterium]